jgi:sugar phosphate isomerase/epimerase
MPIPIALQLYSVREALDKDFEGVVRRVAAMGYEGVEVPNFPGTTPQAAGKLFRELNLKVAAIHMFPPPRGAKLQEATEILAAVGGTNRVVSGYGPDDFKTTEQSLRTCAAINAAYREAKDMGIQLGIHNHWWEYEPVEGRYPFEIMLEEVDPGVEFEIDTYWVRTAGGDPAEIVRRMGKRAPLLHIKDGPATKKDPMQAIGTGVVDFPAVLAAGKGNTEWLIVELDRVAGDMFEAVEKSVNYLKSIRS